jgi:hypothetical protein
MKIFVATYEDGSGCPYQAVRKTRKKALEWLKKQHKRDFDKGEASFEEWCKYGAWTGKIKSFNI